MTINWQKIETGPKDGTRVLLLRTKKLDSPFLPDILWIKVGKWYGHWQNAYFKAWREDSLAAGWDTGMIPLAPTHWAPLPKISEDMLMER